MDLVDALLRGDRRALARAMTRVENQVPGAREILRRTYPQTGKARLIGVTGSPGAGKSTLVDHLAHAFLARGSRVGVVAVDPSSAFSGGAILGDRVRMGHLVDDASVFIRSMATRGHLGGLARGVDDVVGLLDAAGYDPIIVETVGVGQDEIDIIRTAHCSLLLLVPGAGDDVQAIKAGIMEIADIFVVNKADRDGADRLHAYIQDMLSLEDDPERRATPICRTVAVKGEGIPELVEQITGFFTDRFVGERRAAWEREAADTRFTALLKGQALRQIEERVLKPGHRAKLLDDLIARRLDPYTAVDQVLGAVQL